ncbi:MAG: methyltransferase [Methylococcales bacterium]
MSVFHFQQFSVLQQQSAMKVCTDAVLFGAMAPVKKDASVLDIGAGTGLLSLMVAQLGAARITAVEITEEAFVEAKINFQQSPWPDRLAVVHQPIQDYALTVDRPYDLIICNPPFFDNHYKTDSVLKTTARHTDNLAFTDLIRIAEQLLSPQGLFYVLIPVHASAKLVALALAVDLHVLAQTEFRAYQHSNAKVTALLFGRQPTSTAIKIVTIYESPSVYSQESAGYLAEFLLRFA